MFPVAGKHVLTSNQIHEDLGIEFEKRALGVAQQNDFKFRILTEVGAVLHVLFCCCVISRILNEVATCLVL